MSSWIEVSEERLAANYRALAAAAGTGTAVLAVVKANAYGHGAELCAPVLARAGAPWLGVGSAAEGTLVRHALRAQDSVPILVLCGFLPEDVPLLRANHLTPVVWTAEQLDWLQSGPLHLEVDTGMRRQGVSPGPELDRILRRLNGGEFHLDGVLTHFASAEEPASHLTHQQEKRFEQAISQVRDAGLRPKWLHAGNTSSLDNPDDAGSPNPCGSWLERLAASVGARAMVRAGLGLYGYCLPVAEAEPKVQPELLPVLTWKTRLLTLRDLSAGETVGYNATFAAPVAMRVALLGVGYADGLRRELSSANRGEVKQGGWVMISGRRAPILGRISMNLSVIDVSGIPDPQPGDEAILMGEGITADDHARLAGTIAYEILCGLRPEAMTATLSP